MQQVTLKPESWCFYARSQLLCLSFYFLKEAYQHEIVTRSFTTVVTHIVLAVAVTVLIMPDQN